MSDIAIRVENLSKQYRIGSPSTGAGQVSRIDTKKKKLVKFVQFVAKIKIAERIVETLCKGDRIV